MLDIRKNAEEESIGVIQVEAGGEAGRGQQVFEKART